MDGLGLLQRLLSEERAPQGVIVLTNRWDHREIAEDLAKWGVRVVPKPFSPTKLAGLIEELQEQASSGAGERTASNASQGTEHE
jgi:CheY-like chemotaxis protein